MQIRIVSVRSLKARFRLTFLSEFQPFLRLPDVQLDGPNAVVHQVPFLLDNVPREPDDVMVQEAVLGVVPAILAEQLQGKPARGLIHLAGMLHVCDDQFL